MSQAELVKTGKFAVFSVLQPCKVGSSDVDDLTIGDDDSDIKKARHLYNEIFKDCTLDAAQGASIDDRSDLGIDPSTGKPNSFTYGEITEIDSFVSIIGFIKSKNYVQNHHWNEVSPRKFYDLGSGSGRCVMAAALLGESTQLFHECWGIELLPKLYGLSVAMNVAYAGMARREGLTTDTYMRKADILNLDEDHNGVDWRDGFVVFANSTCFDAELFDAMAKCAKGMKPGSIFVTNSSTLPAWTGFDVVGDELRLAFSWGHADVYVHMKRE